MKVIFSKAAQVFFYLFQIVETWIVLKVYVLAVKGGNPNHQITFKEACYILLLPMTVKLHKVFSGSLHNDCFSAFFGYIAIFFLQKS